MNIGDKVKINCPVYKRGKKLYGEIKGLHINGIAAKVLVNGNSKTTVFALCWLTISN